MQILHKLLLYLTLHFQKYFLNALNCQGNVEIIYNNLAVLYLETLDVDRAYSYLEKSINLNKNNVKAFSRLISTSLYLNKDIMSQFKDQIKEFYFDETKYDNYLEQLGIEYPVIKKEN